MTALEVGEGRRGKTAVGGRPWLLMRVRSVLMVYEDKNRLGHQPCPEASLDDLRFTSVGRESCPPSNSLVGISFICHPVNKKRGLTKYRNYERSESVVKEFATIVCSAQLCRRSWEVSGQRIFFAFSSGCVVSNPVFKIKKEIPRPLKKAV
jgi:hypothetical protein